MARHIAQLIAAMEQQVVGQVQPLHGDVAAHPGPSDDDDVSDLTALDGGLNAGSELDDEPRPMEEYQPPSEPGVQEVQQELLSLENRIHDLLYLHHDIAATGGMSKDFAMEAQKLLPGFGGVPLGYYTNTPTITRYRTSMEEIGKGVWALIIAGVVAVIALITKLVMWLSGKKSSSSDARAGAPLAREALQSRRENVKQAVQLLHEAEAAVRQSDSAFARLNLSLTNDEGVSKVCTSFDQAIEHLLVDQERYARTLKLLRDPQPIWMDILTHGSYAHAMWSLRDVVKPLGQVFHARISALKDVVRRDLNSGGETSAQMSNHSALKGALADPVKVPWKHNHATLVEVVSDLTAIEAQVKAEHSSSSPLTFDRIFGSVLHAYQTLDAGQFLQVIIDTVPMITEMQGELDKVESVLRDLTADGAPGAVSQDIGPLLRQAVQTTGQELIAFSRMVAAFNSYLSVLDHMGREAAGVGKELIRKITASMHKSGQEVPPEWQEIANKVNAELKLVTKVYNSFQFGAR